MDDRIVTLLQEAEDLKKELDSLRPLDKECEAIVLQKLRLDWNFHSNHLEGNSLTFGETKALILFGITAQGKPLKDHFEITGHDEAIKWVEDIVHQKEPLTENFIRQLHTLLLKEDHTTDAITPDGQATKKTIKVGEYKSTPNHVKTKTGEIFRFATPEETHAKMNDLMVWLREKEQDKETNPILLAADFHYKFIRIHPFDDGNGRIARILMNFILMQHNYPPVIIKTQEKGEYIAALEQADAGIFDPFLEFIITNEARSLELMLKGAKGGSVEEPDDLDKELALLEQKFKAKSSNSKNLSFVENVKFVIENTIIPLYEQVSQDLISLNKFYRDLELILFAGKIFSSNYEIGISPLHGKVNRVNAIKLFSHKISLDSSRQIGFDKKRIENLSSDLVPSKLDTIELEVSLSGFKIHFTGGQNFQESIFFSFKETSFSIELEGLQIFKDYGDGINKDETKRIIYTLKKNIKEYLKRLSA